MSQEQPGAGAAGTRRLGGLMGWAFTLLALGYAYGIHQGMGPMPFSADLTWYQPRGDMHQWAWLGWAFETPRRLLLVLALPAVALTAAAFLTTRSAVARALAISAVIATLLFTFYGLVASRIWEFFFWRGSAVLAVLSLVLGFSLAAPLLAASWLRLAWPARLAVYLPVFLGVLAFICNATGTDLSLRFAISPWPAVPVFGMEVGSLFVLVGLLGATIGVAGVVRARSRESARGVPIALAFVLGIGIPMALVAAGSAASLLPFRAGRGTLLAVALACAAAILVAAFVGVRSHEALRTRGRHLAVGAALIAVPLLTGELWARFDYYRTREHRARAINDAMQAYLEKEDIYPDELEDLVEAGLLDEIPEPAIGFGFLYDGSFRYRSFGTSYILEFPAPRWVECAYTPPYEDEDEDEEKELTGEDGGHREDFDAAFGISGDGGSLEEAWSCPSKPPELW